MKSLHNFLVNNHVQRDVHGKEIKLKDLKEDDYFAIDYHPANRPDKTFRIIGVVDSINVDDSFPISAKIAAYLYGNNEHTSKPVYVNTDMSMPEEFILRTPNEEEETLLKEIEPYYDKYVTDQDEEIGNIKNMKFIEY